MKSIISAALLTLASIAVAPVANAATGSFDGSYAFNYDAMNLTVQCGYVDNYYQVIEGGLYHYAFPLSEERIPEGTFDALLQWRLDSIEAMNLRPAAEVAAKANAYAFFAGLEYSLNRMVEEYPQGMDVQMSETMTVPYGPSYFFDGMMKDDAGQDINSLVGVANSVTADYALLPGLLAMDGVDYDGIYHRASLGAQAGGNFRRGYGAARWQAQQLSVVDYGYGYGAAWGCGVSTLTGFDIAMEGAAPAERSTKASRMGNSQAKSSQVKLDAKATADLKRMVSNDALKELKREHSLDSRSQKAAAALSRSLME